MYIYAHLRGQCGQRGGGNPVYIHVASNQQALLQIHGDGDVLSHLLLQNLDPLVGELQVASQRLTLRRHLVQNI